MKNLIIVGSLFFFSSWGHTSCLETLMAFTDDARDYPIFKVVALDGTTYGLKGAYYARHTLVEVDSLDRPLDRKIVFEIDAEAIDLELTKIGGSLAMLILLPMEKTKSEVRVFNIQTKTFINKKIPFEEVLTGLQAFPPYRGLHLAAGFSHRTRRVYLMDLLSGAISSSKLKNDVIPGWTRAHPNLLSLDVIQKAADGSPQVGKLTVEVYREGDQIFFHEEGSQEPLGVASSNVMDLPKTRKP